MSRKRLGAGSRLEHDDLDRHIFSAPMASESALLYRIRCHVDLQVMCRAARRGRCFTNVFATMLVTLRIQLVDVLSSFLRHSSEREAQARHSGIIQAISIMRDVCDHVQELAAWGYNEEQMELVQNRFKTLTGWGRRLRRQRISADTLSLVWMGDTSGGTLSGLEPQPFSLSRSTRGHFGGRI